MAGLNDRHRRWAGVDRKYRCGEDRGIGDDLGVESFAGRLCNVSAFHTLSRSINSHTGGMASPCLLKQGLISAGLSRAGGGHGDSTVLSVC